MPATLDRLKTDLRNSNRWQAALVLFAAGSLMALGFAPFEFVPVIFVSLPLLYALLTTCDSYTQALWRGFAFGYGFFMAGTWWIANALTVDMAKFGWLIPICVLGLSAVMAWSFALFGALVHRFRARMGLMLFAALWVIVEYLRTLGMFGFPWNLLGTMALASLPFAQLASVVGTFGLGFLIVLLGLLPMMWLMPGIRVRKLVFTFFAVAILFFIHSAGLKRLEVRAPMTNTLLRVVQPSIPQTVKGTNDGRRLALTMLGRYTLQPATRMPDVTIWPETAYPFTVRESRGNALPPLKILVTGAVRETGSSADIKLYNSVVALNRHGEVIGSYDKSKLVPFGEFVPLRNVLPLEKITPGDIDFSRGGGPATITLDGIPPFSPLVCYEAIFPWLTVDKARRPAWLINVTNDGWYGVSPGPYQHLAMARMRAIEQGLPLVRAANNGVSAIIDPYGRIVAKLDLNQRGTLDHFLPAKIAPTVYSLASEYGVLLTHSACAFDGALTLQA